MISTINTFFKKFRGEEDGNMTIEFVLGIPLIFSIFLASTEMGIFQVRQMFLDRGVDMAVRDVRLNTGTNLSHDDLRDMICDYSGFLKDCSTDLQLSLVPIQVSTYGGPSGGSACLDTFSDIAPSRNFVHGADHEVMLITACYEFDVIFPTTGLAFGDESGKARMFGFSGFVQEPS